MLEAIDREERPCCRKNLSERLCWVSVHLTSIPQGDEQAAGIYTHAEEKVSKFLPFQAFYLFYLAPFSHWYKSGWITAPLPHCQINAWFQINLVQMIFVKYSLREQSVSDILYLSGPFQMHPFVSSCSTTLLVAETNQSQCLCFIMSCVS